MALMRAARESAARAWFVWRGMAAARKARAGIVRMSGAPAWLERTAARWRAGAAGLLVRAGSAGLVAVALSMGLAGCVVEETSGPIYRPAPPPGPDYGRPGYGRPDYGRPDYGRPDRPGPGGRVCPRLYDPVCGDRYGRQQSFPNACEADAAGYRVAYGGQCRGGDFGRPDRPGPDYGRPDRPDFGGQPGRPDYGGRPDRPDRPDYGGRPDRPDGMAGSRPGSGGSAGPVAGGACTREFVPVCGRRGGQTQTFPNACEAGRAGFQIVKPGRC